MDLRPRQRLSFVGFTETEVHKMKHLLEKFKKETRKDDFCKNLARVFNRSTGRAGKPVAKWIEIQNWFQKNLENGTSQETSLDGAKYLRADSDYLSQNKETTSLQKSEDEEIPLLEFEARSSKDDAWYDVDTFLSHRFLSSGEIEFLVRYVGLGPEEDEWVNVGDSLRERSIAMDRSECHKVKVGDRVVCFQDRQDQGRYYDACVIEIQKRLHDIRGCRCLFLIKYDHDNVEEKVRLRRLCYRPNKPANGA